MKYRCKSNYEIVSKYLHDLVIQNGCEKFFEPVYEIDDYVVPLIKSDFPCSHNRQMDKAYQICGIRGDIVRLLNDNGEIDGNGALHKKDVRPATPEEISKATKKFPFEYHSNGKVFTYKVVDGGGKHEVVIVEPEEENGGHLGRILTESAWREIGIRKGWLCGKE